MSDKVVINKITENVIGAAINVHRALGPGLLESAYEACLAEELRYRGIGFKRQHHLPLHYRGRALDSAYRLDFLVENLVVVELKAVKKIEPIHKAQILSYLKLGGWKVGLLMNFNVEMMKHGINRFVLGLKE